MVGSLPKPAQSSEAMGHGSEGSGKYGINSAVPGRYLQCGGTVGAIICQLELCGEQGDSQGPGGFLPPVGATYQGYDGETWDRSRVGVPLGIGGNGYCGAPPHQVVHQDASYDHNGEGGLSPRLCTVYIGRENAGGYPVGAMVVSRHGKLI